MRKAFSVLSLALVASASFAADSIPATGCDIGGFITEGIVKIAAVAAIAVGGYFAFLIIRKGLRWAGKALG